MRNSRRDQNAQRTDDFQERVIEIKRVSKKTQGGTTMSFAALVIVGDKKGQVGVGYAKGRDVSSGIAKSLNKARRSIIKVPFVGNTIPHEVKAKFSSAVVLLKPAPKGSGVIAGGSVRVVVELAGIKDISAKMLRSSNKLSNIKCTLEALQQLRLTAKQKALAKEEPK